jgi:anti-sigma factor RsiW
MLSTDSSSPCGPAETLRDYLFDELPADERLAIEKHLGRCGECALELDRLRLTTAALRTLPDREIPQRIAFISDRVFAPSWVSRFWNSAARLGFASACVLAAALVISAWHLPVYYPDSRTVVQTAADSRDQINARINAAVDKAVAQVRQQIANDDARMIQAAIQTAERKRDQEYRNQMVGMQESFDVLRKRLNLSYAGLSGAGQ